MKNYNKIFKWIMLAISVVALGLLVWGFVKGFPANVAEDNGTVDPLLNWGYVVIGIALFCVIVVGTIVSAINNPKSLVKLGIVLVAIAAVCFVVYLLSPGNEALNLTIEKLPSATTLKLTDTVLNLTYLSGALAILAIVFGEIWGAVRK
ncbi:MAG: hypothetical protein II476_04660 [Bacteroidales bacterium]|jgi:hypothetical protein|nr:hypothetical protein [Bacteroidales bacterium]MBQ3917492.1 hypothetical protein [Bacteroidales bacterium]MBR6363138.1 hypothetical protein [Bacteroidales bacterium]MEE3407599.1 hypothetical protein [Candidatus Cryptobacteroides sp.]MEE3463895.1 hypothetical protein [Candidatus Cryptobacteroides sp.]